MRGVVMHTAGGVRVEERDDPKIIEPTDAIVKLTATCICGSDLWPYRRIEPADHQVMGHEYVGVVEEIGSAVENVKVGDFVVGSFVISDNTCEICRAGFQSRCVHAEFVAQTIGTQAEKARIPHADGTLVATPGQPDPELIPTLLAASDVLGTGWYAAVAAAAGPGRSVAVVGDGAVGLMAVLAAKQLGAERVIAMFRHSEQADEPAQCLRAVVGGGVLDLGEEITDVVVLLPQQCHDVVVLAGVVEVGHGVGQESLPWGAVPQRRRPAHSGHLGFVQVLRR
ncbi:alcohol dehydrogenase catalytic domain-containing protein [Streptomyces sp. JV178]|uniref:alcohol dehydrogenase catalytic domain-containing protein n=1 Tax=Streptomyces sp. JV178 TaxID=858632 RepID=UPI00211ECAFB|nr:alcohol dehydrogenase catalytic domain-containing protein [Streptomyces sp. JV178]